jgi:hypothetical protein
LIALSRVVNDDCELFAEVKSTPAAATAAVRPLAIFTFASPAEAPATVMPALEVEVRVMVERVVPVDKPDAEPPAVVATTSMFLPSTAVRVILLSEVSKVAVTPV